VCNKGITQFYLPLTHVPYLPLLPNRKTSSTFGRYSLRLSHEGMARLSLHGWLVITYRDKCPAPGIELEHGHPFKYTNRARRRLTSLIETNALALYARPPHGITMSLFTVHVFGKVIIQGTLSKERKKNNEIEQHRMRDLTEINLEILLRRVNREQE